MGNFFVSLIKRNSKEDIFTECLAHTLRNDVRFANAFVSYLFQASSADSPSNESIPPHVHTQVTKDPQTGVTFKRSQLDIFIRFQGGNTVAIENKLDSPLGRGQLKKYLGLPVDFVACISGKPLDGIGNEIISNPKYLSAPNRSHFLWHDFFSIVGQATGRAEDESPCLDLKNLFLFLGYDPPHPAVGYLQARIDKDKNRGFAELYEGPLKEGLVKRGWKTSPDSVAELKVYGNEESKNILPADYHRPHRISPWFGTLKIRFRFKDSVNLQSMIQKIQGAGLNLVEALDIRVHDPDTNILDIEIAINRLFEGITDPDDVRRTMANFIFSIFDTIDSP